MRLTHSLKCLRRCTVALLIVFLAGVPDISAAQARRTITETDLFKFAWAADPRISPDGSQVVFVRVQVNKEKNSYETSLYIVPSDGSASPRPLTSGRTDGSPRWSPDGRKIAFVRTPDPIDGKSEPSQIYIIPMDGGEARPLTNMKKGAGAPVWAPDGRTIAFVSTPPTDSTSPLAAKRDSGRGAYVSDVRVITRARYRWNGGGFTDVSAHSHIWTVPASLPSAGSFAAASEITFGDFDEAEPVWSPDGARLYFTSNRRLEPYYESSGSEMYSVSASGGATTKVASIDGDIGSIAVSPDGERIAFMGTVNGNPVRSYDQPDLFVVSSKAGSTPKNLTTAYDFDIGGGIGADQHPPRGGAGGGIIWSRDGKSLIVVTSENGRANLMRFSTSDGKVDSLTTGDHEVVSYSPSSDRSTIVTLISTPMNIGDLFVTSANDARQPQHQITHINEALFSTLDLSTPEEFWYTSFDKQRIQGWILKPAHFDATKKYPLILEIHGGPHSAYGYSFTHEFLWMAAKGYVVLYTNPRGSTSYGQDFGNVIQFHYPGDDYKDLMAGVDEVIRRGYVDSTRLGVTGGSGGGVLTNWIVTQTHRFAAAVSQRSIADWSGFWYGADFTLFKPTWFRAAPWEDPKDFAERSAITHIANVTTPLMLIEGESDTRTPPAYGGEQMFRALKYLHKPTVMVRFPEETHELSRSGKPWHRVERLEHIVGWFDQWLMHQPNSAYEVK